MTVHGETGRQRRWHDAKFAVGLCSACGKARSPLSVRFCDYHMEYARQSARLARQRRTAEKMEPMTGRPRISRHVGPRSRTSYGITTLVSEYEA